MDQRNHQFSIQLTNGFILSEMLGVASLRLKFYEKNFF
ncbi:hypothetical protein EMIT0P228_20589 [Pseudomonas brassicacearum]